MHVPKPGAWDCVERYIVLESMDEHQLRESAARKPASAKRSWFSRAQQLRGYLKLLPPHKMTGMAKPDPISLLGDYADVVQAKASLAPYTIFKVGGPAEVFAQPKTIEQLSGIVRICVKNAIPFRILGVGGNVLIRDEGIKGVVLRLNAPIFSEVKASGQRVRVGCGAAIATLISAAAHHGLTGLEHLVGMPGTVGGALRHNAGGKSGEIGQFVKSVDVMDGQGSVVSRERDELRFAVGTSNLDDPVLLTAEFAFDAGEAGRDRQAAPQGVDPAEGEPSLQLSGGGAGLQESAGQVGRGPDRKSGADRHESRRRPGQRA